MRIHWKKYSWILSLLVVVICSGLAARAFGLYLTTRIPNATVSNQAKIPPVQQPSRSISRDISAIVGRNPFCSTCKPAPIADVPADQAGQPTAPFEVPANLALIVTIISDEPGWSFAAIRDTTDGRTALHTIDSRVPGGAKVKAIQDRQVVLEKDGQQGTLALQSINTPTPTPAARPRPRISRGGTPADIAAGIRRVKPGRFEIQRGALNKLLNNTVMVARSGRVTPHVKGGRSHGFSLSRLRPGGIYQLLGFQNGDNIHAVNGRAITSPESVLPIYRNLRRASHVTISYTRRGKTSTHDYTIR